jgi:hypothetical protein
MGFIIMKEYLFVGHSHLYCLQKAYEKNIENFFPEAKFINLIDESLSITPSMISRKIGINKDLMDDISSYKNVYFLISGNEHNICAFNTQVYTEDIETTLNELDRILEFSRLQVSLLSEMVTGNLFYILPPPPLSSEAIDVTMLPEKLKNAVEKFGFPIKEIRLALWHYQCKDLINFTERFGAIPVSLFNGDYTDFLPLKYSTNDGTHANLDYGIDILKSVWRL